MQAEGALYRQLQKTFKTAASLVKAWDEMSTEKEVESLCNLAEQLQCCEHVRVENTPFQQYLDLKDRLRYKLCTAIEQTIADLKMKLLPLQELTSKMSKQSQQCKDIFQKYSSKLSIDTASQRKALQPSLVDMLEYIYNTETVYRQQLATKNFLLNGLEYDNPESIATFKTGWIMKCPGMWKVEEYLMTVKFFMEEKY